MTTNALDLRSAAAEYAAAYREYAAATRMDVGGYAYTFGGVWDCDQDRLLRAVVLAVRRFCGVCSPAVERAAADGTVRVVEWGYGDLSAAPAGDLYRMPNGMLRDPDGRYLDEVETAVLQRVVGLLPHIYDAHSQHRDGRTTEMRPQPVGPGSNRDDYYTPGRITQRLIESLAGDQVARTLTRSYLVGWPICSDRQKIDACRRVAGIYRGLTECFTAAVGAVRS